MLYINKVTRVRLVTMVATSAEYLDDLSTVKSILSQNLREGHYVVA